MLSTLLLHRRIWGGKEVFFVLSHLQFIALEARKHLKTLSPYVTFANSILTILNSDSVCHVCHV
jgi:hypothetical protein